MKNLTNLFIAAVLILNSTFLILNCSAQNIGINSSGSTPNASALLDVDAAPGNNKGMLIPRVTQAERIAMNPLPVAAQGLTVYQTDGTQGFYYNISITTTPNWAFLVPNSCTGYDNLIIESTSTSTVTITADRLCVDSLSLSNIAVTIDIGVAGAGGLDAGAKAANTWYYVFVISNNEGTSVNGLLSLSSTAPTMPAGYTKQRRVGAVKNNASSNFLQFVQEGNKVAYSDGASTNRILSAGQSITWTSVSATAFLPPTSKRGIFAIQYYIAHNAVGTIFISSFRKNGSTTLRGVEAYFMVQVANVADDRLVLSDIDTDLTQNIEYKVNIVPSGGGTYGAYIDVVGYYDRF